MQTDYWNTEQAAEYLNVKKNTLEIWRLKGRGPAFRKFGRAVRYHKKDLDAYADENRVMSTSQPRGRQMT